MVEKEVGKVNGNETGRTDEKGETQTKQSEQQQCHHGASLGITMKDVSCDEELEWCNRLDPHPPAAMPKYGRHKGDGGGCEGSWGQVGHICHH